MARTWFFLVASAALVSLGCARNQESGDQGKATMVKGTVAYRERMALPSDAVVEVWMTDVTPGIITTMQVLGQTTIQTEGQQVPIPFELPYDPAQIVPDHTYGIRAAIQAGGQTLFASNAPTSVITQGNPTQVELWLERPTPEPTGGAAALANTAWRLTDLGGTPALQEREATLEFPEPGKITGHGSCNRFTGPAEITGDRLQVGRIAATRMACDEAITVQESKYLQALQDSERFAIEGTELLVYSKSMNKPLRFARKEP